MRGVPWWFVFQRDGALTFPIGCGDYYPWIQDPKKQLFLKWEDLFPIPSSSYSIYFRTIDIYWLVVYLPLWKMMEFVKWEYYSQYMEKNVPNHHYLYIYIYVIDNPWRSNPGTLHQIRIVRAQQSIRQLPQRRRLWQRFALEDVQDNAAEAIAVPQQGGLGRAPGRRAGNVGDPEILQDGAPVNEFAWTVASKKWLKSIGLKFMVMVDIGIVNGEK